MDEDYLRDKIEELCDLKHRAEMKHINADRMGDRYLRKQGYELDAKAEQEVEKFINEILLSCRKSQKSVK